jgi:hypothetical protein
VGRIRKQPLVKLIVGFIFKENNSLEKAAVLLKKRFGRIDFESQILAFTHTNYYQKEFGQDLKRQFISFQKLISPSDLPKIKTITNKLEIKLSAHNLRSINIDPGYLELAKLVLASTKDHQHRLYLNKGIFAEITLFFKSNTFKPWEWTYPDYRTGEYIKIFNQIREIYAQQISKN